MEPGFVALGLLVGTLVGMTGVGAGSLVTPALALSGVPPAVAVGTDLAYAAASKSVGAVTHRLQHSLNLRLAGLLALFTALVLLAGREPFQAFAARYERSIAPVRLPLTVTAGALLGVLVTLSSVGAGALGAVLLVALYPGISALEVAGTDIAHAVPLTLVAGLGHLWLGNVDFGLAAAGA